MGTEGIRVVLEGFPPSFVLARGDLLRREARRTAEESDGVFAVVVERLPYRDACVTCLREVLVDGRAPGPECLGRAVDGRRVVFRVSPGGPADAALLGALYPGE